MRHRRTHPEYIAGCFGCKVSSLQIGAAEKSPQSKAESEWEKDLPAYARMRKQGLQPPSTGGAAFLEANATTEYEIASGKAYQDKKMLGEALRIVEDGLERSPLEPVTTPKVSVA